MELNNTEGQETNLVSMHWIPLNDKDSKSVPVTFALFRKPRFAN